MQGAAVHAPPGKNVQKLGAFRTARVQRNAVAESGSSQERGDRLDGRIRDSDQNVGGNGGEILNLYRRGARVEETSGLGRSFRIPAPNRHHGLAAFDEEPS
jgi:hypothetical protein